MNRFLLWNDDNHDPVVWLNMELMGVDKEEILKNVLYAEPKSSNNRDCIVKEIFPWDFEDDLNDRDFDRLFDWFQSTPKFTEEQWQLIFEENWKELIKFI